jgi:hypothetical protein
LADPVQARQVIEIERHAITRLFQRPWSEAALSDGQHVDRNFSHLALNLQPEPVFQKHL